MEAPFYVLCHMGWDGSHFIEAARFWSLREAECCYRGRDSVHTALLTDRHFQQIRFWGWPVKGRVLRDFRAWHAEQCHDAVPMLHPRVASKDIAFEGRLRGSCPYFVASFPGSCAYGWQALTRTPHFRDLPVSCVFMPEGDARFGLHASPCRCCELYGKREDWGCFWFQAWEWNTRHLMSRGYKPLVLGMDLCEDLEELCEDCDDLTDSEMDLEEQELAGLISSDGPFARRCQERLLVEDGTSFAQRELPELGKSQRGEVAWLLRNGCREVSFAIYTQRLLRLLQQEETSRRLLGLAASGLLLAGVTVAVAAAAATERRREERSHCRGRSWRDDSPRCTRDGSSSSSSRSEGT